MKSKFNPTVVALADAIMGQESGGNYGAVNADSGAYGAYQIMPELLESYARRAGIPEGTNLSSPETQDLIALRVMEQYYNNFGHDVKAVAIAWYAGESNGYRYLAGESMAVGDSGGAYSWTAEQSGGAPSVFQYADDIVARMGGKTPNTLSSGFSTGLGYDNSDMFYEYDTPLVNHTASIPFLDFSVAFDSAVHWGSQMSSVGNTDYAWLGKGYTVDENFYITPEMEEKLEERFSGMEEVELIKKNAHSEAHFEALVSITEKRAQRIERLAVNNNIASEVIGGVVGGLTGLIFDPINLIGAGGMGVNLSKNGLKLLSLVNKSPKAANMLLKATPYGKNAIIAGTASYAHESLRQTDTALNERSITAIAFGTGAGFALTAIPKFYRALNPKLVDESLPKVQREFIRNMANVEKQGKKIAKGFYDTKEAEKILTKGVPLTNAAKKLEKEAYKNYFGRYDTPAGTSSYGIRRKDGSFLILQPTKSDNVKKHLTAIAEPGDELMAGTTAYKAHIGSGHVTKQMVTEYNQAVLQKIEFNPRGLTLLNDNSVRTNVSGITVHPDDIGYQILMGEDGRLTKEAAKYLDETQILMKAIQSNISKKGVEIVKGNALNDKGKFNVDGLQPLEGGGITVGIAKLLNKFSGTPFYDFMASSSKTARAVGNAFLQDVVTGVDRIAGGSVEEVARRHTRMLNSFGKELFETFPTNITDAAKELRFKNLYLLYEESIERGVAFTKLTTDKKVLKQLNLIKEFRGEEARFLKRYGLATEGLTEVNFHRVINPSKVENYVGELLTNKEYSYKQIKQFLEDYALKSLRGKGTLEEKTQQAKELAKHWLSPYNRKSTTSNVKNNPSELVSLKSQADMDTSLVVKGLDGKDFSFNDVFRDYNLVKQTELRHKQYGGEIALRQVFGDDWQQVVSKMVDDITKELVGKDRELNKTLKTFNYVMNNIRGVQMVDNVVMEERGLGNFMGSLARDYVYAMVGGEMGLMQLAEISTLVTTTGFKRLFNLLPGRLDKMSGKVLNASQLKEVHAAQFGDNVMDLISRKGYSPQTPESIRSLLRQSGIDNRYIQELLIGLRMGANGAVSMTSQMNFISRLTDNMNQIASRAAISDTISWCHGFKIGKGLTRDVFNSKYFKQIGILDQKGIDSFRTAIRKHFPLDGGADVDYKALALKWQSEDPTTYLQFTSFVNKMSERAILNPSVGNAPLVHAGEFTKFFFQFKKFSLMAINGMLLRQAQAPGREMASSLILGSIAGGGIHSIRVHSNAYMRYKDDPVKRQEYLDENLNTANLLSVALSRSATLAPLGFVRDIQEMLYPGLESGRTTLGSYSASSSDNPVMNFVSRVLRQVPAVNAYGGVLQGASNIFDIGASKEDLAKTFRGMPLGSTTYVRLIVDEALELFGAEKKKDVKNRNKAEKKIEKQKEQQNGETKWYNYGGKK